MKNAAKKRRSLLLTLIASALLFCAPSIASSSPLEGSQNRAELKTQIAQNASGWELFDSAKHDLKDYRFQRTALGSPLAPKSVAPAKRLSNQTVLGHYPDYVKLSDKLGAKRFDIPTDIWNKMTPAQQWAANRKFLDRLVSKGDEIILSSPANAARPGSFFAQELEYLKSLGLRVSDDGLRMIPGG